MRPSPLPRNAPLPSPAASRREIRISNRVTYWPVAPMDLVIGAPLAARLLLGASPLGRLVQAAALGAYLGSALRDWRDRQGVERIDFRREFGADVDCLRPVPPEERQAEVRALVLRLNEAFTAEQPARRDVAAEVDRQLTRYIAAITGQHVRTSVEVRGFTLARVAFPFARGVCDILSGDVAVFQDMGIFEPHIIAHEFTHRKGYWKELHAQVIAYLALAGSGDPVLVQSARAERLYRNLRVLSGADLGAFGQLVAQSGLRPELREGLFALAPAQGAVARRVEHAMRRVYDTRMRLTGQNGISDYDAGFTSFLYTFETSRAALQRPGRL